MRTDFDDEASISQRGRGRNVETSNFPFGSNGRDRCYFAIKRLMIQITFSQNHDDYSIFEERRGVHSESGIRPRARYGKADPLVGRVHLSAVSVVIAEARRSDAFPLSIRGG